MVAKIGHGANITGALSYNQLKVQQGNGKILFTHRMMETPDGCYSVAQLARSFKSYLLANRRTEKPVLHISLNPDPRDQVSDEDFGKIAQQYMQQMGYGDQPFVVFKHMDTGRPHIHIVSVCVDEDGKKIADAFERRRSMQICRTLENQYNRVPATERHDKQDSRIFQPVDHKAGDVKSQVASIVRHLSQLYRFQSFGSYNALLSLFNIKAEEVKGELHGEIKNGLVYFALNEKGEKIGNPFKASLFGKMAGYSQLQTRYERSKVSLKTDAAKVLLKETIEIALHTSANEADFKRELQEQGIDIVIRRNDEGRIYGVTFIDHTSKTVWNGSHFGKNLSANVFQDWWNNGNRPKTHRETPVSDSDQQMRNKDEGKPYDIFTALEKNDGSHTSDHSGVMGALDGLLPEPQGENFEEQDFANRMKKKKSRRKPN